MSRLLVLIERTNTGAAYRYSRFVDRKSDYIVETPAVDVGKPLETLGRTDVELFRVNPKQVVGE